MPHLQTYELEEAAGHDAVHRAERDPREARPVAAVRLRLPRRHLRQLRDGRSTAGPALACRTLTQDVGPEITLAPLPVFELIGDLSVNTGKWMRGDERAARGVGAHRSSRRSTSTPPRGADGPGAGRADLRARPLHRVRLLRGGLRHGAHARGLRRRGGPQQDRPLPPRPARRAHRRRLLRA
ncbi:MAG: hypothetical protein MZV64_44795 [Ignavibacteriales bacterium]|nr:hypothetical protein [Ignavibacteriales bacterium]